MSTQYLLSPEQYQELETQLLAVNKVVQQLNMQIVQFVPEFLQKHGLFPTIHKFIIDAQNQNATKINYTQYGPMLRYNAERENIIFKTLFYLTNQIISNNICERLRIKAYQGQDILQIQLLWQGKNKNIKALLNNSQEFSIFATLMEQQSGTLVVNQDESNQNSISIIFEQAMSKRIAMIIEDHPVVIEGLRQFLNNSGLFGNCITASTGEEALTYLRAYKPDVVLLDLHLPDISGIELCKKLLLQQPQLKILAISSFSEHDKIKQVLANGALGYVLKNASDEEILQAINDVIAGNKHIADDVKEILLQTEGSKQATILTHRETEVLQLIADGFTNTEIAEKLNLSPLTIDSHRKNLLMKLDARNTAALIKIAIAQNLIKLG